MAEFRVLAIGAPESEFLHDGISPHGFDKAIVVAVKGGSQPLFNTLNSLANHLNEFLADDGKLDMIEIAMLLAEAKRAVTQARGGK